MKLFSTYRLGSLELKNRLAMAPMTRSRAIEGGVPHPKTAVYYAQRASAGLLISEGSQVSPQGAGYIRTPGIYSAEQIAGWKKVTDAVHQAGGKIFIQLWHVGRASHPDFHDGQLPVAPSAIAADGESYTPQGPKKMVTPRALETSELAGIVEQFRQAAKNALAAGFDGAELHGANGYLLDQFTRDGSNQRTDAYGGSVQNRIRLPLEVAKAVVEVMGGARVGYRVSPNGSFNSMKDSNPVETFSALAQGLSDLGVGYLHNFEAISGPAAAPATVTRLSPILRKIFKQTYIINGGFDGRSAEAVLQEGEADLVAFGVPYLANPDLAERLRQDSPLNQPDFSTFYTGEEKGWIDYPALETAH